MAAAYESFAHRSAGSGASITVTKPAGTVNGDLLLVLAKSSGVITPPAGVFTQHAATIDTSNRLLWKIASGEPADYVFTQAALQSGHALIVRISGADLTNPIDAAVGIEGTGSLVLPSITSLGAGRLLWQFVHKRTNTTFTVPGPPTEQFDATSTTLDHVSAGGSESVGAGATGTRTWTPAAGSNAGLGFMLAIKPAGGNAGAGFMGLI